MYRKFLLLCIFITGMVSLVYQMVWQRYMAILVGSEAKSSALVVAIFLLGLASGYALFGHLTEKKYIKHRQGLLKFYGWVECLTAIYVIIFPYYFVLLQKISFSGPLWLIFDIFIVSIAILLPTVLMGATIPLMTMVFPASKNQERNREIDSFHAQIYGINTLGAFVGTIGGGYFLIPLLGLPNSLLIMGGLNFLVSVAYIFNPLSGNLVPQSAVREVRDQKQAKRKPKFKDLKRLSFYGLVFVVGSVTIGLEILLIRIVALTIGFNVYVFPTVLGIVVLGIGLGSLHVVRQVQNPLVVNETQKHLYYQTSILMKIFLSSVILTFFYWFVTYLPSVINHIRVSLVTIASNQFAYLLLVFITFGMLLIPAFYLLGSLLPLVYCSIDKNQKNYGRICGFLYFFNTVGSLVGGVILGYWLLHFFSIEGVFKLCLYLLLITGFYLSFQYMKLGLVKGKSRFTVFLSVFFIGFVLLTLMPKWDRRHHYLGLFRNQELTSDHFNSWFLPETYSGRPVFIEDGPNSTITVLTEEAYINTEASVKDNEFLIPGPGYETMSIIVNGKSDGNSWGDFPTVYALALLPYMHAPLHNLLQTAVIGFGTGITSGTLGRFAEVKSVETLEISHVLVRRHPVFDPVNFKVSQNPKISVINNDAFKFLTHSNNKYDVIIAEPSNPWVVGVENLFSLEMYKSARQRLNDDGVFAQWFHTYSMNLDLVKMIYSNLSVIFPYVISYRVGTDIIILAKRTPFLDFGQPNSVISRRFSESFITSVNESIGINDVLNLKALELTNEAMSLHLGATNSLGYHTLTAPQLTFKANKAFFLDENVSFYDMINYHIAVRHFYNNQNKFDALQRLLEVDGTNCSGNVFIDEPFCPWFQSIVTLYNEYRKGTSNVREALVSYSTLRRLGFLPLDREFLGAIASAMLEDFNYGVNDLLIKEMYVEGLYFEADTYLDRLQSRHIVTPAYVSEIENRLGYIKVFVSDNLPQIFNHIKQHQEELAL